MTDKFKRDNGEGGKHSKTTYQTESMPSGAQQYTRGDTSLQKLRTTQRVDEAERDRPLVVKRKVAVAKARGDMSGVADEFGKSAQKTGDALVGIANKYRKPGKTK